MSFEQAFVAFVVIALLFLLGALLCFLFDSKIKNSDFFSYYFAWAAVGLLIAFIVLAAISATDNGSVRKSECRSEITPALVDSDLSTEEVKVLLNLVCK